MEELEITEELTVTERAEMEVTEKGDREPGGSKTTIPSAEVPPFTAHPPQLPILGTQALFKGPLGKNGRTDFRGFLPGFTILWLFPGPVRKVRMDRPACTRRVPADKAYDDLHKTGSNRGLACTKVFPLNRSFRTDGSAQNKSVNCPCIPRRTPI